MSETTDIYQQLLDVSREAFANKQGVVAYHALSGALEYAFCLKDAEKVEKVRQLANTHILRLLHLGESEPMSVRAVEIDLYNALLSLCSSYQNTLSIQ
ncbi:hypothetical protein EON83_16810 [bacterium]|nr:MAG: hypothetical protein EON83_16810 [bacterium]